jgi:hypothetical protein
VFSASEPHFDTSGCLKLLLEYDTLTKGECDSYKLNKKTNTGDIVPKEDF